MPEQRTRPAVRRRASIVNDRSGLRGGTREGCLAPFNGDVKPPFAHRRLWARLRDEHR
jgi:hypothetical protein